MLQEGPQPVHGDLQLFDPRKIDYPEMVVFGPVEACSLDDEHLLLLEQFKGKLLVVGHRVHVKV